jgi:hypothetical protein
MKLGTEKPGITTAWFPVWYTLCPHKGITSGDGRCCSKREVPSSNMKGVFLADGGAKDMRRVCTHHKKTPLVVQNVGFRLGVLGTVGNIIPVPPKQVEVGGVNPC